MAHHASPAVFQIPASVLADQVLQKGRQHEGRTVHGVGVVARAPDLPNRRGRVGGEGCGPVGPHPRGIGGDAPPIHVQVLSVLALLAGAADPAQSHRRAADGPILRRGGECVGLASHSLCRTRRHGAGECGGEGNPGILPL